MTYAQKAQAGFFGYALIIAIFAGVVAPALV